MIDFSLLTLKSLYETTYFFDERQYILKKNFILFTFKTIECCLK